jgi:type I restriction-modification system DNA methylase subunit
MNDVLKFGLQQLEMLDENHPTGLVRVQKAEHIKTGSIKVEEIIALENAHDFGVNYVYFRRFSDRSSIPQVYIYDYTNKVDVIEDDIIKLHQRLYSSGAVPMFFVITNNDVRIFNCFEKPAKGDKLIYKPLTTIKLAANISDLIEKEEQQKKFEAFSGKTIDNGTFWENSSFRNEFEFSNSAYEKLLFELKQALKDIIDFNILPVGIAKRIMVISILIKYLEERTDEHNNSVFPKRNENRISYVNGSKSRVTYDNNFFEKFASGANCFSDVLKISGAALILFDYLARHFNGGVFNLSTEEREALKTTDLSRFALFLEGELQGVQFVFWRLYSFNDLPVELISNIYEEFLEKKPGVVYTPPYLVNFLLDEAMPFSDLSTNFKILDPACGSGVFLVGAFRRLIYRWRLSNKWAIPDLLTLKTLLKENIYGCDKDNDAVNLSIFSLSLALCDELTPLQIWDDLEFDNLSEENLLHEDFFNLILSKRYKGNIFNLVIGNPPFESKLTAAAGKVEATAIKDRGHVIFNNKKSYIKLPDTQIALLFLEQSIKLVKKGCIVCLIEPSGPLLYNGSSFYFRQHLLTKYNIPQIIDFTHISRVLFGKNGDVATAAIFVKNEAPTDKGVLHITVRRTKTNKEKIYFELDSYDFHYVPRILALNDSLIWKANFLGGSRVHLLIRRLIKLDTLADFIKAKGWTYEEGFMIGGNRGNKPATYITGSRSLPASAFNELGVEENKIYNVEQSTFYYLPNPKIFQPPHVLIKEIISNDRIPVVFRTDPLTFQSRIVGINAPMEEIEELKLLAKTIAENKIYPFYIAGTSGQYLVNKSSAILKSDIDKLPYPEDHTEFELDEYEQCVLDDFWKYLLEFRRNGEKSLIAIKDADEAELLSFGNLYCSVLSSVYPTINKYSPLITNSFICYPFYFNEKPNIEFVESDLSESSISKLINKSLGQNLRITRIIRIYEGNVIYLIKPKKLRYWLPSIALRDADETFTDLRKQGF